MSQTLPRVELPPASGSTNQLDAHPSLGTEAGLEGLAEFEPDAEAERAAVVEVAIPVYNEEHVLEVSTRRLREYLDKSFPFRTSIKIVDNASTDGTWAVASRLVDTVPGVTAVHLDEKGKGRAVRAAWCSSTAEIVCYMDVDLSTDLGGLLPLVAPLLSGHSDVSIGSRFAPGAHVLRGARREAVSTIYNFLLRGVLRSHFTDATCGFKAARRETAQRLLPLVDDNHWFFDTEFLVLAERSGFRIHEVPVDWVDDADSRVDVAAVAWEDLRGVVRLISSRTTGDKRMAASGSTGTHLQSSQSTRYASVGVLSTLAYVAIFFLLRGQLGIYAANVIAMAVSTIGNTVAHLCFTFGPKSSLSTKQAVKAGILGFLTGVGVTTAVLGLENLFGVLSATSQVVAILLGLMASAFVRLILLRSSAYRTHSMNALHVAAATPSA